LRAPGSKRTRQAPPTISARLGGHVTLEARANGTIVARFHGYAVGLGMFSADAAERAQDLGIGLPLAASVSGGQPIDQEVDQLIRRLASRGLLEYRLVRAQTDADAIVIEPQMADYWPRMAPLDNTDRLVLSRFAYMRRRGNDIVLESPRAGALFRICDPRLAAVIATLSTPQRIEQLQKQDGFPGGEFFALLADCEILFKVGASDSDLRPAEGDADLVLWDFHDLLFHTRSTQGRHANPAGGVYAYAATMPPLPAVRPRWEPEKIDLRTFQDAVAQVPSPVAKLFRERHSTRDFDAQRPITLAELARFLDVGARVQSKAEVDLGDGGPPVEYAARPYPSAGSAYELELYLAVNSCEGLARGFYHYDADGHALMPIDTRPQELKAQLKAAEFAMGAEAAPQILITIAARFGRVSWKYSSIAYALILKDAGVLIQTLYLAATDLGLGGCAIGTTDVNLFAKMTGLALHVEGPVGQFALGRS
jgi:SagB-type dehydrogenase family enzyme